MATKARVKVGDVFAIALANDKFALSLCTFVFRTFKNGIACRVFDVVVDAARIIEPLPAEVAFDPLFMGKQIITAGTWPIVASMDFHAPPLRFRVAGGEYNGNDYVGPAEDRHLPEMLAYGPVAVQRLLRQHFGIAQDG